MITIKKWNEKVILIDDYPCEECPMGTTQECIIYWDETEVEEFGPMNEHECYKLRCKYFKQANE